MYGSLIGWGGYFPRGYLAAGLGYPYQGGWAYPCWNYGCYPGFGYGYAGYPYRLY